MSSLEVRVTIPSESGGAPIAPDARAAALAYVARQMSALFGGATATPGAGCWTNGNGELIQEQVTIMSSYAESDVVTSQWQEVRAIAQWLKNVLHQESVLIAAAPVTSVEFV